MLFLCGNQAPHFFTPIAIRCSLVDNKLPPDPNDYRTQVEPSASIGIKELTAAIVRPGSTVTQAELLAAWEEITSEIIRQLKLGNRVVLDLLIAVPSIEGVFNAPDEPFDRSRHHGRIKLSANTLLRKAASELVFEPTNSTVSVPVLHRVDDFTTDALNASLTPGGVARLTGELLKFDPADATQGLFLIAADGTATRVDRVKTNTPKEQLFVIPGGLARGSYQLEMRVRHANSQNLRKGTLRAPLTIH